MTDIKNILIAYPPEFLCYEKLKRKIDTYTSQSGEIELVCFDDVNEYVKRCAKEKDCGMTFFSDPIEAVENSTHAIILKIENASLSCVKILKRRIFALRSCLLN